MSGDLGKYPTSAERWKQLRHRQASVEDRIADAITAFSGSMTFVIVHVIWFAAWIIANEVLAKPFDAFPYGLLTMIVSLEAIFLSTFVLISQNRQADSERVLNQIEFETDVQSDVWSEMIAEKLGIDRAEVQRRVQARLADADRQSKAQQSDSTSGGSAHAPSA